MSDQPRADRVLARIAKSQAAVESFARIAEEFKAIRKNTPNGPARDRIDGLMKLNAETLAAVGRSLELSEEELARCRVEVAPEQVR